LNEEVDEILEKIEGYYGLVPKIYQILAEYPELLRTYFEKSHALIENSFDSGLSFECIELLNISAAAALGAEHCLNTHIQVLKSHGIEKEKIVNAILIGAMISETFSLSKSLRTLDEGY